MNYVIGDIHANHTELSKLLGVLKLTTEDSLIFLGDYLDKNPYTLQTLETLRELMECNPCTLIKGNHDYVWEHYLLQGELERRDFLLRYGGIETLRPFTDTPERLIRDNDTKTIAGYLKDYLRLISNMKGYDIAGDYLAIHAGITREQLDQRHLILTESNFFMRPASIPMNQKYLGTFTLIAGHTHLGIEPVQKPGYVNIDLGAGYGKYLGAFCIERKDVIRSDGATFHLA